MFFSCVNQGFVSTYPFLKNLINGFATLTRVLPGVHFR
jgi:hypothetical protein